jgi:hypothetical protein
VWLCTESAFASREAFLLAQVLDSARLKVLKAIKKPTHKISLVTGFCYILRFFLLLLKAHFTAFQNI